MSTSAPPSGPCEGPLARRRLEGRDSFDLRRRGRGRSVRESDPDDVVRDRDGARYPVELDRADDPRRLGIDVRERPGDRIRYPDARRARRDVADAGIELGRAERPGTTGADPPQAPVPG